MNIEAKISLPFGMISPASSPAFVAARQTAERFPRGAIYRLTIERAALYSDSQPSIDHAAFVANGDGSAEYVVAPYPASRLRPSDADLLAMAEAARATAGAGRATAGAIAQQRRAAVDAKGITVGATWRGARAYISGQKGITNFKECRILAIDDDGMVKVQATKRGASGAWLLTVEPDSHIFDNYGQSA